MMSTGSVCCENPNRNCIGLYPGRRSPNQFWEAGQKYSQTTHQIQTIDIPNGYIKSKLLANDMSIPGRCVDFSSGGCCPVLVLDMHWKCDSQEAPAYTQAEPALEAKNHLRLILLHPIVQASNLLGQVNLTRLRLKMRNCE